MAVTFHRSAFGAWWRWRTELSAFTALAASYFYGWWQLGSWLWPLLVLAVLVVVLVAVPGTRHLAADRFWVLFARHRLQRSFWELRLHTRAGRLPLVPWITATPVGVRAWVLLRAGMTFADFEDSAAAFASACGARDCRVTASARWAWLVCIDIIRRDVLGPRRIVLSPLAALPATDSDEFPAWPEPAAAED